MRRHRRLALLKRIFVNYPATPRRGAVAVAGNPISVPMKNRFRFSLMSPNFRYRNFPRETRSG
jgi:hypothetical protein